MFVFGINLPVAEILFVVLLLFIVALVMIIRQLIQMNRHVKILDETTLEIRRYEEAEEITLRAQETDTKTLKAPEMKQVESFNDAARKLQAKALKMLLSGKEPATVRHDLIVKEVPEALATRVVNDASYWLDKAVFLEDTKKATGALDKAAKK